jgi:hypothetical protein
VVAQLLSRRRPRRRRVRAQDDEGHDALPGGLVGRADDGGLGDRGCDTSADSTSVVEMRWPETFMTSSTRPSSQIAPSSSSLAPSPAK